MLNCLSALKAVIALLHYESLGEGIPGSLSRQMSEGFSEILCSILECAFDILQDSNFMLDCRSTAGMAIVSILQYLLSGEILQTIVVLMLSITQETVNQSLSSGNIDEMRADKNELNRKVAQIIKESFRQLGDAAYRYSKLIICHGLITKLNERFLHGISLSTEATRESSEGELFTKLEDHSYVANEPIVDSLSNKVEGISLTSKDTDEVAHERDPKKTECEKTLSVAKKSLFTTFILNCILDTCAVVNEKGMTVYAFRTLYSWTAEAMNHCNKLLGFGCLSHKEVYSPRNDVTPRLIFTLNNYLDHPVDAVRHQVRNSLENVIRIINLFPDSELHIQSLLSKWLHGNLKSRSKCLSLSCISDYVSVKKFLHIRPNLPVDLLDYLNDSDLASHICDLYVKSASKYKSGIDSHESSVNTWVSVWCEPVFKALSTNDPLRRSYVRDYIVPGLLKSHPELICLILDKAHRDGTECQDYKITSIVFLSSARSLQECSRIRLNEHKVDDQDYWHGLVRMEYMKLCLAHIDEQVSSSFCVCFHLLIIKRNCCIRRNFHYISLPIILRLR